PVIRGNHRFSNTGAGIQFNGDCHTLSNGQSDGMISGALVEGNLLHDNGASAFSIINLSDSIIRNNVAYNNSVTNLAGAIKLADEGGCNLGSNRNLIVNNTLVANNGAALIRIVTGTGVGP